MKKNKKQEELQSRREFFKKAAKGALPILGAIALSQMPMIGYAQRGVPPAGCKNGCYNGCYTGCQNACKEACAGYCKYGCKSNSRW